MGAAAYNRGSKLIRQQITAEQHPVEFEIIQRLNAIPKVAEAPTPFGPIDFVFHTDAYGRTYVIAECPVTGFGFWFRSLKDAITAYNVEIVGITGTSYNAVPRKVS